MKDNTASQLDPTTNTDARPYCAEHTKGDGAEDALVTQFQPNASGEGGHRNNSIHHSPRLGGLHGIFTGGSTRVKIMKAASVCLLLSGLLACVIIPSALLRAGVDDVTRNGTASNATDTAAPALGHEARIKDAEPLRVGAFNVRHFGKTLMGKSHVVSSLVKILRRYDIFLVQEVRDSSHNALRALKNKLLDTGEDWSFVSSQPIGRSRYYREQYVYFYKTDRVKVVSSYQVKDSKQDVYAREPFAVRIEYTSSASGARYSNSKRRVVLLGLHATPDDVEAELRELAKTVRRVARKFPDTQGVVAMGDFNADCSYLNQKERGALDLFSSSDFVSLISDSADTTVSKNTDCAYDRIILYRNCQGTGSGDEGGSCMVVKGATVFNYETFLNIGHDAGSEISDHYPVEFLLY